MSKNKKQVVRFISGFIVILILLQFSGELLEIVVSRFTKTEININKPWYRNAIYGFSFETPEKLTKMDIDLPPDYIEVINIYETHGLEHGDLIVFCIYMDSNFEDYDTEIGLSSSIQNSVNSLNGTGLNLNFSKPESSLSDLLTDGTFTRNGKEMLVKGYVYWSGDGKIVVLASYIPNNGDNSQIIDKIINSRIVAF